MAIDILLIPVMSADPERLFSSAKISVSDRRNRLGIYTLEALECLKSWLNIELEDIGELEEDVVIKAKGLEGIAGEGAIKISE